MKKCSRCRVNPRKNKGKDRYCLSCHSKNMREWRKTHFLNKEQQKKSNCRSYTKVYIKRGKIKIKPCEICNSKAEVHHLDYNKPLLIKWFCRKHHLEYHRNLLYAPEV